MKVCVRGGRREWSGWYLAGFVLGDFVLRVLFALFAFAVGAAGFGDLDLRSLRQNLPPFFSKGGRRGSKRCFES